MTAIRLYGDSDLAGAIDATINANEDDLFLTLRNQEGKVLWSQEIWQWKCHGSEIEIGTRPIREKIDRAVESYRLGLEMDLRQKGLL